MHYSWDAFPGKKFPQLSGDLAADVIVIGGGVTGASAAYHLAKAGKKVALLEAETVAHGASGKNFGMLVRGTEHDFTEAKQAFGPRKAAAIWRQTQRVIAEIKKVVEVEKIDCDFENVGSLNVALNARERMALRKEFDALRHAHFPAAWLEGAALSKRLHSPKVLAALFNPGDAQVSPKRFVHGLITAAAKRGASVFEQSPAIEIGGDSMGSVVRTPKGRLTAKHVFLATETETPRAWRLPGYRTQKDFGLITKPVSKSWCDKFWRGEELVWNFGTPYFTFRKAFGLQALFYGPTFPQAAFKKFFTDAEFKSKKSWECRIGEFDNGLPYVGQHPTKPNLLVACGFRGHGMTLGFLSGRLISERVLKRKTENFFARSR